MLAGRRRFVRVLARRPKMRNCGGGPPNAGRAVVAGRPGTVAAGLRSDAGRRL